MPPDTDGTEGTKFFGIFKKAGMPKMPSEVSSKMIPMTVNEWTKLSDSLFVTGPAGGEISLVMITNSGPVLICGCCHSGIMNVISSVKEMTGRKVTAAVGGMHLTGTKRKEVHELAEALKENGPPMLYLSHCTGVAQRTYLREKLGLNAVKEFYAGTEIRFDV
jgi:metal-dependent hydrolase (beta-lactamase superfamily II)